MSGKAKHAAEAGRYVNASASAKIKSGAGRLIGIFVNSTSSGTLKLWDNTAGSGTVICNTITPAAGAFYRIPAEFAIGLFVTIGGTIDYTVFFENA